MSDKLLKLIFALVFLSGLGIFGAATGGWPGFFALLGVGLAFVGGMGLILATS